jgi:hypothetical protein
MKALVYHGPSQRGWGTVDDPTILDPTDAIVRIDTTTICGTGLHILKGDVPETTPGHDPWPRGRRNRAGGRRRGEHGRAGDRVLLSLRECLWAMPQGRRPRQVRRRQHARPRRRIRCAAGRSPAHAVRRHKLGLAHRLHSRHLALRAQNPKMAYLQAIRRWAHQGSNQGPLACEAEEGAKPSK